MLFRQARGDTLVSTVEARYGIDLNARSDTLLGNLLEARGFDSLTQLLAAYGGRAKVLARRRRLFLSFHAEDRRQVQGFRLMGMNPGLDLEFFDGSVREAVNSSNSAYIRQVITDKIRRSSVVLCLIGDGTAWRDWVDWELRTGYELGKGLCGVRLKGSRGRTPILLAEVGAPVIPWDPGRIVAVIEQAAAKRS